MKKRCVPYHEIKCIFQTCSNLIFHFAFFVFVIDALDVQHVIASYQHLSQIACTILNRQIIQFIMKKKQNRTGNLSVNVFLCVGQL